MTTAWNPAEDPSGWRGGPRGATLSREEERALTERGRGGDRSAIDALVQSHLGFVVAIAKKYRRYGVPMNDLVQEGVVGLLRAIGKFDPQRDVRLSTYARWWVRAAIQEHVVRSWSLVRIGTTAAQRAMFFQLRRMAADLRDGADALTEDVLLPVARRFGVPLREAIALAWRASTGDRSLNQTVRADGDTEWIDGLADDAPTPEEIASAESEAQLRRGLVARALDALSHRERTIIAGRFLAEIKRTRDEIGAELGISKERVRQLEQAAVEKLQRLLAPLRNT
jgi:RNA polymerase sigma-32 factor